MGQLNAGVNRRRFLTACAGYAGGTVATSELFTPTESTAATASGDAIGGRWIRERIRRGTDPLSGAEIWQLTSAAAISHDIYGEQLYCSADGTRIAFLRCATTDHRDGPMDLFVADLHQKGVKRIGAAAYFLVAGNGRQDALLYVRHKEEKEDLPLVITRLDFSTLERRDVFEFGKCPPPQFRGLLAISPDERWCLMLRRLGGRRYGIERIDLKNGTWQLIHENDDIFNAHLQFNSNGDQVMVQHNRGGELDEDFNAVRSVGPEGATLYVIDIDGKNRGALPIGKPHTAPVTGHECWIGESDDLLLTTQGGKVYRAAPGDEKAQLISVGSGLIHISASPDGRFFVVDSIRTGRLFLGCLTTKSGKSQLLPLCDTGASGGSPQYTHTHPYITPGNSRVVFNSDRTGIAQVYTARIPEDMLAKLEADQA